MVSLLLFLVLIGPAIGVIDLGNLIGGGGGGAVKTRNVFVTLTQGPRPVLDQVLQRNFSTRGQKITAMTNALQAHSLLTQGPLMDFLKNSPLAGLTGGLLNVQSFWISNQIFLKNVNPSLLTALTAAFPTQIAKIEEEKIAHIIGPMGDSEEEHLSPKQSQTGQNSWGVPRVGAQDCWKQGVKGDNIIVGIIDTGVHQSHETLINNFGGDAGTNNYGWFDPSGQSRTVPSDGNGHGTHCAGTICGQTKKYEIGVAPGAKWIACRGCAGRACTQSDLTKCGEWMSCPTDTSDKNKRCDRAPHVVSNSWGAGGGNSYYDYVIDFWHEAEITPVFAIGNSGSDCRTGGSPGDGAMVIGVGAISSSNTLSWYSSRGPAIRDTNRIKPDVSAPGQDIWSAWPTSNSAYARLNGTSMACPHVAGVVALMLSSTKLEKRPKFERFERVRKALTSGCNTTGLVKPNDVRCGKDSDRNYKYPNNDFGYGVVNAPSAVANFRTAG